VSDLLVLSFLGGLLAGTRAFGGDFAAARKFALAEHAAGRVAIIVVGMVVS
jgi:hypothetical protein